MDAVLQLALWSHECCGPAIERGDRLNVSCCRPDDYPDVVDGIAWVADRHFNSAQVFVCEGTVIDLWAVGDDGVWHPIERLPSGRAICGFGDGEDGSIRRLDDQSVVPGDHQILITVAAATIAEIDISDQVELARRVQDQTD